MEGLPQALCKLQELRRLNLSVAPWESSVAASSLTRDVDNWDILILPVFNVGWTVSLTNSAESRYFSQTSRNCSGGVLLVFFWLVRGTFSILRTAVMYSWTRSNKDSQGFAGLSESIPQLNELDEWYHGCGSKFKVPFEGGLHPTVDYCSLTQVFWCSFGHKGFDPQPREFENGGGYNSKPGATLCFTWLLFSAGFLPCNIPVTTRFLTLAFGCFNRQYFLGKQGLRTTGIRDSKKACETSALTVCSTI